MWCTMCKAQPTIVLTPRNRSATVASWAGAWSQARGASIRSEYHAWENCPCRSNSGTFRDGGGGAGSAEHSPSERRVLLGDGHERIGSAGYFRHNPRRVGKL